MRTDVFVYLAGPISPQPGISPETHIASAIGVFLSLIQRGIPSFVPHATAAFPSCWKIDWQTWMDYDDVALTRCTHMLMLPNWQDSKGATHERRRAEELSIPIFYSVRELVTHLDQQSA